MVLIILHHKKLYSVICSGVNCGQHHAESCAECPGKDGWESFCNGQCEWINNTCVQSTRTPENLHKFMYIYKLHKVYRCLARYSPRATTTNRPTNRALNKPAWPGPYQPKMPILGQIWSFLGKKSFFFTGEIKSFVTHITENPPRHLIRIGFWSGIGRNGQKMPIFWTKFGRFLAKNPILGRRE